MGKASDTGGVKAMTITGRFQRERERLLGMTDAERKFRAQWVKDQELSHNEPRKVPEIYKEQYNVFRRMYRAPLDSVQSALEPVIGANKALIFRYFSGKLMIGIGLAYAATYYSKYCRNDWTKKGGWYPIESRTVCLEGDPGYPKVSDRSKGSDYADRGFNSNTLNL